MTYTKIPLPETNRASEINGLTTDKPEIHITEKDINYTATHNSTRSFFPSASTFFAILALCLASFIIGCCSTDAELCNTVICINTAASGRLPYASVKEEPDTPSTQGTTVYRKYMTDSESSGLTDETNSPSMEFLAADPYESVEQSKEQEHTLPVPYEKDTVPADNSKSGMAAADGEILYPVVSRNLAADDLHVLSNQTSYKPDTYALLNTVPAALENIAVKQDEPLVLIVHTHGTECYNSYDGDGYYSTALPVRSEDISMNVVSMGEKVASVLNSFGIPTLHSTKMCDKESFVKAYSTSYAEVKKYLAEYPSIRFVIDLHRDSIESSDHTKTKPITECAGENAAQLMFVVGTNASGNKHPNWKNNLSLALNLQKEISALYPGLFRRINLRTASFNQQLSDGYLLLECGSCANTHKEAENAAEMFATGFAKVIKTAAR